MLIAVARMARPLAGLLSAIAPTANSLRPTVGWSTSTALVDLISDEPL